MGILKLAGKKELNIREFIENTASAVSFKYSAVPGAKHHIYIPTEKVTVNENGVDVEKEVLIAYSLHIHELRLPGDKYRAVPCLHGVEYSKDGVVINDGSCPFCDRVGDAWDIVNYRIDAEDKLCTLVGEDREKQMDTIKKNIRGEIKLNSKTAIMYLLVFVFNTDAKGNPIISEATGLPEYTPKIWKLRTSRIEKMQEQLENAGGKLEGCELVIKYPDSKDARQLVTQSVISPLFTDKQLLPKYPTLKEQMTKDAAEFNWDNLESTFSELADMSTAKANDIVNDLFKDWDAYKERLKTDANAVYLEYRTTAPNIATSAPQQTAQPVMPAIGTAPQQVAAQQAAPSVGVAPQQTAQQVAPQMDANDLFGANNLLV